MSKSEQSYTEQLEFLQAELVKAQASAIESGQKLVVVFEGRDAAGKDGTIRRIIEHLSPRNTRVVALPKPSDRERGQWYFQRYAAHLPGPAEWVLFNRSWYNRGGVEPVMDFCTPDEHERFLDDAPVFERMIVQTDTLLVKFWLDISKAEQEDRLKERRTDPLKLLKTSPLDAEAQKRWADYSKARDEMLTRTHTAIAPWVCVRNDKKKKGRIAVLQHLLHVLSPPDLSKKVAKPDPAILFPFEAAATEDGRLEA